MIQLKKVVFADRVPETGNGKYLHYEHTRMDKKGWEYGDIRKIMHENQEQWITEMDKWHAELSRIALGFTQWWWFLEASTFFFWYPPTLKPLFFALSVIKYCEQNVCEEIYLIQCPGEVNKYIKEFAPDILICYEKKLQSSLYCGIAAFVNLQYSRNLRLLKYILQNLKILFYILFLGFSRKMPKRSHMNQFKLFVYSNFLDEKSLLEDGDFHFRDMFQNLPNLPLKEILWIYIGGHSYKKKKLINHLNSKGFKYVCLEDYLAFSDFEKVIIASFKLFIEISLLRKRLPSLEIGGCRSVLYPKVYFSETMAIEFPLMKFLRYFALKNLNNYFNAEAVIYPYEEASYERTILRACNEKAKKMKTIGHCLAFPSISNIHYKKRKNNLVNSPRPDFITVTGDATKEWFINYAEVNPSNILVIGYSRYSSPLFYCNKHNISQQRLKVLVLSGFPWEINMLANYVEQDNDLFDNCDVIIRGKRLAIRRDFERGVKRLKEMSKNITVETGIFNNQLKWCDVAIFCNSTAGFDAMLKGRLTIYVDLNDYVYMEPFYDFNDKEKHIKLNQCHSPIELKKTLVNIRNMDSVKYNQAVQEQIDMASKLFTIVRKEQIAIIGSRRYGRDIK